MPGEKCVSQKKLLYSVRHVSERNKSKQSVNIKDSSKTGVGQAGH